METIYFWDVEHVADASYPDAAHPPRGAVDAALKISEEDLNALFDHDDGCPYWWTNSHDLNRVVYGALAVLAIFSMNASGAHLRWSLWDDDGGAGLSGGFYHTLRSYEQGVTYEQWQAKRDELIKFLVATAQRLYRGEAEDLTAVCEGICQKMM